MSPKCLKNEESEHSLQYNIPDFVQVYQNGFFIKWDELGQFLKEKIGSKIKIEFRRNFLQHHLEKENDLDPVARKLVTTKVFDISDAKKIYEPFPVEVKHEKELMADPHKSFSGNLYDGFRLQSLFRGLLAPSESNLSHLHLIFTNRSIATWNPGDGRYHARTSVYGFPCIISTTGLVEAPAKPKDFYIIRKGLVASGMLRELVEEELKHRFAGRFIEYDDERLTDIVKGYAMQAFFYHLTFEPFCVDKNCRLFNAHWQEEMIHAQLEGEDLCERHEGLLEKIKELHQ